MNTLSFPTGEIWVVDDSVAMRLLLRRILQAEFKGWTIREMANGLDALNNRDSLLGTSLVITDMEMPEVDGEAFLERLMGDPLLREKQVLLLSGGGFRGLEAYYKEFKNVRFLEKPCRPGEIVQVAKEMLAGEARP